MSEFTHENDIVENNDLLQSHISKINKQKEEEESGGKEKLRPIYLSYQFLLHQHHKLCVKHPQFVQIQVKFGPICAAKYKID